MSPDTTAKTLFFSLLSAQKDYPTGVPESLVQEMLEKKQEPEEVQVSITGRRSERGPCVMFLYPLSDERGARSFGNGHRELLVSAVKNGLKFDPDSQIYTGIGSAQAFSAPERLLVDGAGLIDYLKSVLKEASPDYLVCMGEGAALREGLSEGAGAFPRERILQTRSVLEIPENSAAKRELWEVLKKILKELK